MKKKVPAIACAAVFLADTAEQMGAIVQAATAAAAKLRDDGSNALAVPMLQTPFAELAMGITVEEIEKAIAAGADLDACRSPVVVDPGAGAAEDRAIGFGLPVIDKGSDTVN